MGIHLIHEWTVLKAAEYNIIKASQTCFEYFSGIKSIGFPILEVG